jgi:hypothetical protein
MAAVLLAIGALLWGPAGLARAAEETEVPAEAAAEENLSSPSTFETEGQDLSVLSIQSRPEGARVFVDGEERGTTPIYVRDLSEGSHEIILYLPGRGAYRQVVDGRGGRIFVDLDKEKGLGIGFLSVTSVPPDARVEVDGERVGLSPLEVPLDAGRHTVHLAKTGYKDHDAVVEVEPEGRHAVDVRLEPREGALLVISSPTGAEVFVDGRPVGTVWEPLRVEGVPPGVHGVRLEKAGYRAWEKPDVQVRRAETTTVLAALLPERDYSWVRLFSDPAGVRVWLDGEEIGVAGEEGLGFKTSKGVHNLRLETNPAVQPGYQPLQISVNFTDDEIDYRDNPLVLPPVDENLVNARSLIQRGNKEDALGFLDRVPPDHPSYAEARLLVVDVFRDLGRIQEIPSELYALVSRPENRNNPVLNTALGYWSLVAARDAQDQEAVNLLVRALDALDRAAQAAGVFPPDQGRSLILKAHFYTGIASEILFNLTGERKYINKGGQAWEVFFARLELTPDALEGSWIEKARSHRRSLEFLAKKLGG